MALLAGELQWAGQCVDARHGDSVLRARGAAVRVGASGRGAGTPHWRERPWRSRQRVEVRCAAQKSLYETLGVAPTGTEKEIKRADRGLALKFLPDVNKRANSSRTWSPICRSEGRPGVQSPRVCLWEEVAVSATRALDRH